MFLIHHKSLKIKSRPEPPPPPPPPQFSIFIWQVLDRKLRRVADPPTKPLFSFRRTLFSSSPRR
ncbi:hypothetical protein RHGRI_004730 [Rhododendron griersonianum]|uniref:Uncharacterized protein n=1 Tax=Rhododendron griersonianum TaxID=479676 RepID=A0AAV6LAY2_9ERIC|nr:hypothetical protein RHGRI_004730 [Rhododendron griersonianum]